MRDPIELFIESKYSKKEKKFFDEYSTLYKVIKKLKYTNNTHSLYQTDGLGQKLEIPYKI